MKSSFLNLDLRDFANGAVMFVGAALLTLLGQLVLTPGFDVFTTDWVMFLKNAINIAIVTLVTYLIKNLLTNKQGEVLGIKSTK